jgi:drug/metabolite transporter (DMT)-like permease
MSVSVAERPATTAQLVAAFAAVYVIWGSTYLGIRFAVETLPPFSMAGLRFLTAGAMLYGWARLRGAEKPTAPQWKAAAVVGALLLLGGNGLVSWAEQYVASGVAALLVTSTPLWMVLLDWARPGGVRPRPGVFIGLALGFVGVVVLVGPGAFAEGEGGVDVLGALAVLGAALSWAVGSLYSRTAPRPASTLQGVGMQMLAGGAMLLAVGLALGERVEPAAVSARSWLALAYLVVFGALVGYTAYVWLLRHTTAAKASTYAYVNPVIAVLLGAWLADEALDARVGVAGALIVGAVALITTVRAQRPVSDVPSRSDARIER